MALFVFVCFFFSIIYVVFRLVVTYKRTPVAVRPVSSCATTNKNNSSDTRQQHKNESTGSK